MIRIARVGDVPEGRGATIQLRSGGELALFNIGGRYFAVETFCPHKGAPLADARLYGQIVECDLHGWRFDVTNGKCINLSDCDIESYEVVIEDGWVKVIV